ncbi:MAG: glycosyltransferase [Alphaproteobacteria bacterium]
MSKPSAPAAPFRIYIGWDSREQIAYEVCRSSLLRHASIPLEILPLKQQDMRARGLYARPPDPLASTEFTYTRFFVPHLAGYEGWALFCDCDFLWTADVAALVRLADPRYGALCVQHDYRPPETVKMDGAVQTVYPRKNWSSLILFNCAHPQTRRLSPDVANRESGAFLHRFQWLDDAAIGALPETWNWLEGWCAKPAAGLPSAIHYTRGGPWFDNWRHVDYAAEWLAEAASVERAAKSRVTVS